MQVELSTIDERDIPALLRGFSYNGTAGLTVLTADGKTTRALAAESHTGRGEGVLRLTRAVLESAASPLEELARLYADYVRERSGHPRAVVLAEDAPTGRPAIAWQLYAASERGDVRQDADPIPLQRWNCAALERRTNERPSRIARFTGITGKVAVITGAAQGFGWEIAQGLAEAGAQVVIADINERGAIDRADELTERDTAATTMRHAGFGVDVTDESSVRNLAESITATHGGVDIVVSNAGVLRAGPLTELSTADFAFVTRVNYSGFFQVTRSFAPLLGRQNAAYRALRALSQTRTSSADLQAYFSDIVQINSKSGLVGSNKNSAYAGSKFGGIGLVQSFALELVEHGIKVNALCPGNFFDGPLWSDPKHGLFVQYLAAGKVPGAKTIDEVRAAYEAKVPMGRGCTGTDVVRALLYTVDQRYETGQALPITGGQVMLS